MTSEAVIAEVEKWRTALETFMGTGFTTRVLNEDMGGRVLLTGPQGNQEVAYLVEDRLIVDEYVPELGEAAIAAGADPSEAAIVFTEEGVAQE